MKYRILNYPQTIEGCHDLIKILVAELNEYENDCEEEMERDILHSLYQQGAFEIKGITPSTHDNKFTMPFDHPAGINGGTQRDGGVDFMNFEGDGVPSTTRKNV